MLSFDIRSLETRAVVVDDELSADDPVWRADDPKPAGPVHVTGRLSAAGEGRFYWHGRIEGDIVLPCRRCLANAVEHVTDDMHLIYAESGDKETDDPDVYRLDERARELDLRPALREQWLLVVPGFALCREECLGLCPRCGADLNEGPCDCPPESDSQWEALRKLDRSSN
jgi:DUF177 domain-containing protein